jgi:hypothetical protein
MNVFTCQSPSSIQYIPRGQSTAYKWRIYERISVTYFHFSVLMLDIILLETKSLKSVVIYAHSWHTTAKYPSHVQFKYPSLSSMRAGLEPAPWAGRQRSWSSNVGRIKNFPFFHVQVPRSTNLLSNG